MVRDWAARWLARPRLDDMRAAAAGSTLRRALGWKQLTALGVGAIVGAGVFSVIGTASSFAGPAVVVSFVIAAVVALLAALAYAELAAMIPLGGSAYTYVSAAGGELFAWLVGWALVLSYGIGNGVLASTFSDNLSGLLLTLFRVDLPDALEAAPGVGGVFDLPAFLIVVLITLLLLRPTRDNAIVNAALVGLKVLVLLVFLAIALPRVSGANLQPFAPGGAGGILTGAAAIFFAFLGFDAISTAAEETRDPQRDLPRGILGSILVVTLLFVAIGFGLTGLLPQGDLDTAEPLALALRTAGFEDLSALMNLGAIVAGVTVLLVFQLAAVRVVLALARDGLVPKGLAAIHEQHGTPNRSTLILGAIVALASGLVAQSVLVILTNIASFFIFGAVMVALLVLRRTAPDAPRPFRCPGVPFVPILGILSCVALGVYGVLQIPVSGWAFAGWMGLGVMLYAAYGVRNSVLRARA